MKLPPTPGKLYISTINGNLREGEIVLVLHTKQKRLFLETTVLSKNKIIKISHTTIEWINGALKLVE